MHLSQPFLDAAFAFSKALSGATAPPDRWKRCTARTDGALGFMTGRAFVDVAFSAEQLQASKAMIAGIKTAFKGNLKGLSWMDAATQQKAAEKADAVYDMIGYPDWIQCDRVDPSPGGKCPKTLATYYASFAVGDGDSYFQVHENGAKFDVAQNIADLSKPVDKFRWGMSPPTVNAYYSPSKNEIVFPAGILQPPFYHGHEALAALNFGGIGSVIGHELTHGFDDQGARYDKDGNLEPWWPAGVTAAFKLKTQCIEAEYDHFMFDNEHVNGKLTLGENIADNGGIKQSYTAWQAAAAAAGAAGTQRLPGLPDYGPAQLFFISYAQVWCNAIRPEEAKRLLVVDPHAPHKWRVNGVMQNQPSFAEAFQCAAGTPMNPGAGKRCTVW